MRFNPLVGFFFQQDGRMGLNYFDQDVENWVNTSRKEKKPAEVFFLLSLSCCHRPLPHWDNNVILKFLNDDIRTWKVFGNSLLILDELIKYFRHVFIKRADKKEYFIESSIHFGSMRNISCKDIVSNCMSLYWLVFFLLNFFQYLTPGVVTEIHCIDVSFIWFISTTIVMAWKIDQQQDDRIKFVWFDKSGFYILLLGSTSSNLVNVFLKILNSLC